MKSLTFLAHREADTERLGQALADVLGDGVTVALIGTLGAGKTRLVQAVAKACGVPAEQVVSPTFTLCHEYHGARTIYHFDAYRLRDDDEFLELGPEEYFDAPALTFVEWGDRILDCLPRDRVEIHLQVTGEESRAIEILARSAALEGTLERLAEFLGAARDGDRRAPEGDGPTG